MRKITLYAAIFASAVMTSACGNAGSAVTTAVVEATDAEVDGSLDDSAETAASGSYITLEAEDGKISIPKDQLSASATFINYNANGTKVQLIAGLASDNSYRVSLNTCQSCNPSPQAYYAENQGLLVCQNCGNQFTMDEVGATNAGCNPMFIESEETDTALEVTEDTLKSYADRFQNWAGPEVA